jgi:hypothetical protein
VYIVNSIVFVIACFLWIKLDSIIIQLDIVFKYIFVFWEVSYLFTVCLFVFDDIEWSARTNVGYV